MYCATSPALASRTMGRLCVPSSHIQGDPDEAPIPSTGAPYGRYRKDSEPISVCPERAFRLASKNDLPFDGSASQPLYSAWWAPGNTVRPEGDRARGRNPVNALEVENSHTRSKLYRSL